MDSMHEELETLLFDWEAGTLDEAGVERVRELLRTSAAAREYYARHQVLSAALKLDVDAGIAIPDDVAQSAPVASSRRMASGRVFRISSWAAATVVLLICVLAGRLLHLEFFADSPGIVADASSQTRTAADEPTAEGVALVTRLVNVVWPEGGEALDVGDALTPGRLAIQSGYAQVEFFCGATVVVEGPAELELISPVLARVRSGRLRAHVPPAARGFSLEVDDLKVVDLGTEFGLSVSPQGADVQVFDGEVELHERSAKKRILKAGAALVRMPDGTYSESQVVPSSFLDIATLESRAAGQRDERYERWRAASVRLRRDARLIAYYSFDQAGGWDRALPNSLEPGRPELDGAIVGARRVPGRWSAKSGLEFKRPGDRVRVNIPGEYSSLTFVCWVKIDSLDRWYNSLFLTDGYNQGEPHWQILDSGQLFFSVRHRPDNGVRGVDAKSPAHQKVLSPPFWKPALSGRWLHLATTYDANAGRTTHYLNGEVLHEEVIDDKLLVKTTRIGAASIGNWSIPTRPDAEFAIRNLNGSIDEFAIFAASLAAEEIRELYDNGKP